jgi:hypothetical protein
VGSLHKIITEIFQIIPHCTLSQKLFPQVKLLKDFNELFHVNCRNFWPLIMSLFTCKCFMLNSGKFSRFYFHKNRFKNSSFSSMTMIIFINFNELYT